MVKKAVGAFLVIAAAINLSACSMQKEKVRYSKAYLEFFDTVTQIVGYEEDEETFSQNCEKVYSLFEEYHQLTDIYHSYEGVNNVRTINRSAGIEPVKVDEKLIDLLEFSKEMYTVTNGKCNIAMGSVLSIWHKYREQGIDDPESAELPPVEDLVSASEHCSIDDLIIDRLPELFTSATRRCPSTSEQRQRATPWKELQSFLPAKASPAVTALMSAETYAPSEPRTTAPTGLLEYRTPTRNPSSRISCG